MSVQKNTDNWVIALRHYLLAGLAVPLTFNIVLFVALWIFVDKVNLVSSLLSLILSGGSLTVIFIFWQLYTILILTAAFYFGTQWSYEHIKQRYIVTDRNRVIYLSTMIYFFAALAFVLLIPLFKMFAGEAVLLTTTLPWALMGLIINTGIFYLISKLYFFVDIEKVRDIRSSPFVPIAIVLIVIGTTFLGYRALERFNPIPSTEDRQGYIDYTIREIKIIPLGDELGDELDIAENIIKQNFPNIAVQIMEARELSPAAYDEEKSKQF